ncbi:metal ABC transporter substrate-binding protein [soil metagenome]
MRRLSALFALMLALAACGDATGQDTASDAPTEDGAAETEESATESATESALEIVATTSIMGDLVSMVVQDDATVEVLLPIGADPHDFAPSAAQATTLRSADLVVANGLNFEEGLVSLLEGAAEDGVVVFEATDHVELIEFDDDHGDEDDHGDDHGDEDPHVWFDAARMAGVVEALGAELTTLDDSIDWEARAAEASDELLALDEEIREILADVPDGNRILVVNHDVLGYFADAYDFEVAATVIPGGTTLSEPSAADLRDVIEIVSDTGVSAIFAETTAGAGLTDVVADEVGRDIEVVVLYTESLSDADGPAATYIDMMRTNATRIAEALG